MIRGNNNPIYSSWRDMIRRCYTETRKEYKYYGGKGITVCDRWQDFQLFCEDMAPSWFEGATIDRIDNSKNYSKDNCRWSTINKQQQNKGNVKQHWLKTPDVKALHETGLSHRAIADRLDMSKTAVWRILSGKGPQL